MRQGTFYRLAAHHQHAACCCGFNVSRGGALSLDLAFRRQRCGRIAWRWCLVSWTGRYGPDGGDLSQRRVQRLHPLYPNRQRGGNRIVVAGAGTVAGAGAGAVVLLHAVRTAGRK